MLKIFSLFIILYSLACLFLYIKQRSILYFPTAENVNTSTDTFWLQTSDATLKIWIINKDESNQQKPAILYFGGNSETVEDNITDYKNMFSDFTVYLVNYRGYGGSTGKPTEAGLFSDALAIYDQLIEQHSSISVIGRSLGSGVASYVAAHRDVLKLVLITPYDSIRNVAQSHYPFFPVKWLIKDQFDSSRYASSINCQILVMYAEHDQVVPMVHTKELLKFLPNAKSHLIKGTAHNDISSNNEYQNLLMDFFNPANDSG